MEANAQKRYRRLDVSESGLRLERGFTEATISSHLARVLRETFGQWISPEMTQVVEAALRLSESKSIETNSTKAGVRSA